MTKRRDFIRGAFSFGATAWAGSMVPSFASAQTKGGGLASWAGATHPKLLGDAWAARFSNTLPWILDPSNAQVLGGFVMKPNAGSTTDFSVKASQGIVNILGPGLPDTTVWGYEASGLGVAFPGRTFVVNRNVPITVSWSNNLVDSAGMELPHLLGVDQTIAMQTTDPNLPTAQKINGVPIAVHHHGGASAPEFDGGPDQWFTPSRKQAGPGVSSLNTSGADSLKYTYANTEEASMHWYHDHADGITRINAYAGLAGLYIVRDANEAKLITAGLLPTGEQEVPLVISDRVFQANGEMAYVGDIPAFNGWNAPNTPATPRVGSYTPTAQLAGYFPLPIDPATGGAVIDPGTGNPVIDSTTGLYAADAAGTYNPDDPASIVAGPGATHVPEFYGEVICVNGKAWPNLKVEPRQYRLRLLNGSDSRVYNLKFGGLVFWQIGTDQGLLNSPVPLTTMLLAPGERKDVVIDFSKVAANSKIVLTNDAAFPYPGGAATLPTDMWATVMQFDVSKPLNETVNKKAKLTLLTLLRGRAAGTPLLPIILTPPKNVVVRKILLGEGCDEYGRIMPLLGTVAEGTKTFHEAPDIFPVLNSTEVWEFWNTTVDAHPIHMHLVKFRVVNRQAFTGAIQAKSMLNNWTGVSFVAPPVTSGLPQVAPATEQGWKDTVVCPPGFVTRIVATFDKPGTYVYHCHILGHEEHDMMRWFKVA
jgi:spore coat protein A